MPWSQSRCPKLAKKRKGDQRDWWIPSSTPILLNLQSICVERWGGSHRQAASQSFERLFSEPLLLWPVGHVSNKAVSEKAGWLASGTLLYMWRALQFAGKMRRDREQKHFLVVRAESSDEPVCHTVSSCYGGQWRRS
ncbi:Hypothetical predicted protein [Scomber scombrus]|uniref:Uncharacterized protein n=1 Tax=Scomber scombrus TaxID=13677 RepID=A0AAV1MZX4_SCOSC